MTRNNADFQGLTYKHYDTHPTSHELEAFHPKSEEAIGYMRWDKKSGEIKDLSVDKEQRRKGVGTGMYNAAINVANSKGLVEPVHSPVRTAEGEAWARSLPDYAPSILQANYESK